MTVTFLVGGEDEGPHELEFWVCLVFKSNYL